MASGVASPWGMSPRMVAGIDNTLDDGDMHLTGQLSLTATPVTYDGNIMLSPLTRQNQSYYTAFGKRSNLLKQVTSHIKYLKRLKE